MSMFNDEIKTQLRDILIKMDKDVTLALFTSKNGCHSCEETKSYMMEMEDLTQKLHLKTFDLEDDADLATEYNVTMVPSIVLLDSENNYKRIKFNGIPAGHEINSFINSIIEVSGTTQDLSVEAMDRLSKITKPIDIKVFVTLSCPHCAGAVSKAHKLALVNPNISADMIEASTFGELSDEFNVSSVPKIVINGKYEFVGNQPFEAFLEEIEKVQLAS